MTGGRQIAYMGDMTPESLLRLLDIASRHSRQTAGTLGRLASGSGDFVPRLRRGHDITSRRAAKVCRWLSDHWPEGAEWPADIPRPEPSSGRKDAA